MRRQTGSTDSLFEDPPRCPTTLAQAKARLPNKCRGIQTSTHASRNKQEAPVHARHWVVCRGSHKGRCPRYDMADWTGLVLSRRTPPARLEKRPQKTKLFGRPILVSRDIPSEKHLPGAACQLCKKVKRLQVMFCLVAHATASLGVLAPAWIIFEGPGRKTPKRRVFTARAHALHRLLGMHTASLLCFSRMHGQP